MLFASCIRITLDIGCKIIAVIGSFYISDKPAVDILSVDTTGSSFSVEITIRCTGNFIAFLTENTFWKFRWNSFVLNFLIMLLALKARFLMKNRTSINPDLNWLFGFHILFYSKIPGLC